SGRIWIGTENNGFLQTDSEARAYKVYSTANYPLSNDAITAIAEDNDGTLWISTWNGGVMRFDPATESLEKMVHNPRDPFSIPINDAKTILPDDSVIWVGTHGEGLAAWHKKRRPFIHHRNNPVFPFQMNLPGWINHLFKDSNDKLWISTYSGLFVFDGKGLSQFVHSSDSTSLSSNSVNMVTEDEQGRIWIATEAGLDSYNSTTNNFTRHRETLELAETVKAVVTGSANELWISTGEGIYSLDPDKKV